MIKNNPSISQFSGVDVSLAASASSIVFEVLKKAIIEGELPDGTPLKQEELAKKFNTSRIPIRECISRLEQEGLVRTIRYRGAVVASISVEEVEEMFDLRSLLESEVIGKAMQNLTPDIIDKAEHYSDLFAQSKTSADWTKYNRLLHLTLYEAANLSFHLSVINTILDRTERFLRAQLSLSNGMNKAIFEHKQLINYCRNKDIEKAKKLTFDHVQDAKKSLLKFISL